MGIKVSNVNYFHWSTHKFLLCFTSIPRDIPGIINWVLQLSKPTACIFKVGKGQLYNLPIGILGLVFFLYVIKVLKPGLIFFCILQIFRLDEKRFLIWVAPHIPWICCSIFNEIYRNVDGTVTYLQSYPCQNALSFKCSLIIIRFWINR